MKKISIVIPTYRREQVLVDTIHHLLRLDPPAAEIVIVDQSSEHVMATTEALREFERTGKIRWLRLTTPSIPHAMNVGLQEARCDIVAFLDDDIVPLRPDLIGAHARAHEACNCVAGQVLQPGEEPDTSSGPFQFRSTRRQLVSEFIGCNVSMNRTLALRIGGFDENFVRVAYRFEAEFAARFLAAGERILFEPAAGIRHLKASAGGTRTFGNHLKTVRPSHAVGEYYFLLRSRGLMRGLGRIAGRPLRAIRTKHHLTHPWWIVPTLLAEASGFIWALYLNRRGPQLIPDSLERNDHG